jgi:hypothetical protein
MKPGSEAANREPGAPSLWIAPSEGKRGLAPGPTIRVDSWAGVLGRVPVPFFRVLNRSVNSSNFLLRSMSYFGRVDITVPVPATKKLLDMSTPPRENMQCER